MAYLYKINMSAKFKDEWEEESEVSEDEDWDSDHEFDDDEPSDSSED